MKIILKITISVKFLWLTVVETGDVFVIFISFDNSSTYETFRRKKTCMRKIFI